MGNAQWALELALLLLLAATLFHALRLERALGVLKQDRAVLEELVSGFNDSTKQAESGIERLRAAADGAGRQMARQIEAATHLRDDLNFLVDRSDRLAERLEAGIRSARMIADTPPSLTGAHPAHSVTLPANVMPFSAPIDATRRPVEIAQALLAQSDPSREVAGPLEAAETPRLRSQAERDLLRVLRAHQ